MNYSNIYDSNFLDKFGQYRPEVSFITLESKYKIDVLGIAEKCNIPIEYTFNKHSDWREERKIMINKVEPEYKQRFTIAHKIGHIILNHQGKSYRAINLEKYSDTIDRMNEVAANNFAAQLIMPEKLVKSSLIDAINKLGYSVKQSFSEREIKKIIDISAYYLDVSIPVLSNRIDSLGLFVD